jgi:hypothetical protein
LKVLDKKGGRKVKCNGDCENCVYDDCIASTKEILEMDSKDKGHYTGLGNYDELSTDQKYYVRNREKYIARAKKYYADNKEKKKEYNRKYYQKHKEEMIARALSWQKENWFKEKERQREKARKKRETIKNGTKTV